MTLCSLRSLAPLVLALSVVGCPKDDKKDSPSTKTSEEGKDKDKEKKSGDDKDKPKKEKDKPKKEKDEPGDDQAEGGEPPAPKKPASGHVIGGIDVPAWQKPTRRGKCTLGDAEQKQLDTLKSGDDGGAGFDDGKGDVDDIIDKLKKGCPSAPTLVSQAINAGGYTRYSKKEYAKADGWFARALVADETNTFARYNLACNLALHGQSDDALWNLEQLLPAAKAGDPRAKHYLRKAASDSDLTSVKKDPRFTKLMSTPYEESMAPCPEEGQVHQAIDKECLRICSAYGAQGGCPAGQSCTGATAFGDGLVPFCADTFKCKDEEARGYKVTPESPFPEPGAKPSCFVECSSDSQCDGKKCTGTFAIPSPYGFTIFSFCE